MFRLHPRLKADTRQLCELILCEVRLMNDRRFPWLILVPRRPGVTEVHQLEQSDQRLLMVESSHAARVLEQCYAPDKINLGALGNLVPQLHWHVVARRTDDPCWPGPVWGCGEPLPYAEAELQQRIAELQVWFTDE
jgi:diadenosine tetraphosphate (Ap4A) HIT family hydrolase